MLINHGLGRHVLVECYDAGFEALNDLERIRDAMLRATTVMQATMLSERFHKFAPQGVSGAVVIAESHLTIHTWPELGYAAIDFFTCGACDPLQGFQVLAKAIGSGTMKVSTFARGFPATPGSETDGANEAARHVASHTYVLDSEPSPSYEEALSA